MPIDAIRLAELYESGQSTAQIARSVGLTISAVRKSLQSIGVTFRSAVEGRRLAGYEALRGRKRPPFSAEHKGNISAAKHRWAAKHARGTRVTVKGYIEYTRGVNKGRKVHDVLMEEVIGRRLVRGEQVHHVDGNKANNAMANLRLLDRAEHMRIHRKQDHHLRKRGSDGRLL